MNQRVLKQVRITPKSKMGRFDKKPVWQKRFKSGIKPEIIRFTDSTNDDDCLVEYEIFCSIAHAEVLKNQGIISKQEFLKIKKGLNGILRDYKNGKFRLLSDLEDVHMNVEFRLKSEIGIVAEKLHTARSRNDLIATDLRLYCRDAIKKILKGIVDLQEVILQQAKKYRTVIIPGYTHLQQAQPMLVSFYLASFFYKFQRDFWQFYHLLELIDVSPLGSCAFAGTGINIDRKFLAKKLGFQKPCENALDGVSDRDFAIDFLYYLARIMIHISTLAEDFVIFSTKEFKLIELDDSIATGSSIMPQKKNPDVCELLRAKSAKAMGSLVSGLALLKGVPSSYNRDLQELKPILFRQVRETVESLYTAKLVLQKCKFNDKDKDWARTDNIICVTDLIEYFVKKGYRFREIYNIVGECVKESEGDMNRFKQMLSKWIKVDSDLIAQILTPDFSIKNKVSEGGTGDDTVRKSLKKMANLIKKERVILNNLHS